MKLKPLLFVCGSMFLSACATTSFLPEEISNTKTMLSIESAVEVGKASNIQREDFLIELRVKPSRMVRATETIKIDVDGPGFFKVSQGDKFFTVDSEKYGHIFCAYKHLHVDTAKTITNQGCLSDKDYDNSFDSYFVRTGSLDFNDLGFLYYDGDVAPIDVPEENQGVAYTKSMNSEEFTFDVAFKLDRITRRKGSKYAIFEIYTKRLGEDIWHIFPSSEPVEVHATNNIAVFSTPMFTAELTDITNKSLTGKIVSVADKGHFGFDRTAVFSSTYGNRPAYTLTGRPGQ